MTSVTDIAAVAGVVGALLGPPLRTAFYRPKLRLLRRDSGSAADTWSIVVDQDSDVRTVWLRVAVCNLGRSTARDASVILTGASGSAPIRLPSRELTWADTGGLPRLSLAPHTWKLVDVAHVVVTGASGDDPSIMMFAGLTELRHSDSHAYGARSPLYIPWTTSTCTLNIVLTAVNAEASTYAIEIPPGDVHHAEERLRRTTIKASSSNGDEAGPLRNKVVGRNR